uniref:Exportin-2 central domain-containing protein n=1 Tax=Brassica campestris TaxID=3711 RepID=M4D888_BRACM
MIYTGRAPRCLKELLSRWCCLSGRNLRSACTAVAGGQEMRGGGACLEWSCPLSFVVGCLSSSAVMSAYARLSFVLHNLAKQKGISVRVRSLIELSELDKAAQISRLTVCEESYHGWDTKVMMCNDIISSMCKAKSYIIRGFLDLGEHDMANHLFDELLNKTTMSSGHMGRAVVDATFVDYWFKQGEDAKDMDVYMSLFSRNVCASTGNTLLEILFDNGKETEAWDLFNAMLTNNSLTYNRDTFGTVVNACFKFRLFKQALHTFKRPDFTRSSRCYATIIALFCEHGMMSQTQDLFDEICSAPEYLSPDVPTFISLINGYAKAGRVDDAADLPRHVFPQLQLEGRESEDLKKSFRSLLELSIKWRIPTSHMSFMMKVLEKDDCCKVLKEKGTVRKVIKDVVVENIQVTAEEKTLFWKDFRKFITQNMEDSSHPKSRRRVEDWSSRGWREKECGIRLSCVLADIDQALDVYSFATNHISKPILMLTNIDSVPIMKAAALRLLLVDACHDCISISRSGDELLSMLEMNIGAASNVVHSYVVICVSVLLVKEDKGIHGARDISPELH